MEKITAYLKQQYPDLITFFDQASPLNELDAKNTHIVEAMARIIVGQMLSRHVARTIFQRVEHLFQNPKQLLECNDSDFTQHGVSKNKAKAILNFAEMYFQNPDRFEQWPSLDFEQLRRESKDIWGVSDWSLSILALFHFGQTDVFPEKDGTLKRALFKLREQGIVIEPNEAMPYRSYLALYLWKFIDEDIIQ